MGDSNRKCVAGVGEILWDMLPSGKQLGGAPANFAYHAQLLGAKGYPVSAVGDDALGHEIINVLRDIGLEDQYVAILSNFPTGTVTVDLDEAGKPDYTIHEGVAWDYIPFTDDSRHLTSRLDAVCYGTLAQRSSESRRTIHQFIDSVGDGCLRVYDVNLRQAFFSAELLRETLAVSDVMKLNDEELPIAGELCGLSGDEDELLHGFLNNFGLELIALTKGGQGSRLYAQGRESSLSAPAVEVVDTVGAGDSFTAALVVGLLNNYPIGKIHQNATNLAARVCAHKGATPRLSVEDIDVLR